MAKEVHTALPKRDVGKTSWTTQIIDEPRADGMHPALGVSAAVNAISPRKGAFAFAGRSPGVGIQMGASRAARDESGDALLLAPLPARP